MDVKPADCRALRPPRQFWGPVPGLIPSLADVVHRAVEARGGLKLVPSQLRCALGEAGSAAFLEAPLPYPGGLADRLVVRLSGNLVLADPVPLQEFGLHVALGIELAGVDEVGEEQGFLFVCHDATLYSPFTQEWWLPARSTERSVGKGIVGPDNIHYVNFSRSGRLRHARYPSMGGDVSSPSSCLLIGVETPYPLSASGKWSRVGIFKISSSKSPNTFLKAASAASFRSDDIAV